MLSGETKLVDDANRPLAIFTPSIWGDHFIKNSPQSMEKDNNNTKIIKLKKEVKKMFEIDAPRSARHVLELVDAIQRLGLTCHFVEEIEAALKKLLDVIKDVVDADLHTVALHFRLLRQQGYNIPCETFMKFKDKEGKFKESLKDDIRGMLSLYEASHLRCHGEEILDEALTFTTTHLKSIASKLSTQMSEQVNHSLKHPIRKSMQRREARRYILAYEQENSRSEALLTLAKLDFNDLQLLYKKELNEVTRWWKEFCSATKLGSFLRDRIVECFFWAMAIFCEAEHSVIRVTYAKLVAVLTHIDDIYDSFGTLPELHIFTEAMERWDHSAIDELPEYMKISYKTILEFYDEVEENAKEIPYCIEYAKRALLRQVRGYLDEAKWLHKKEIPTFDEYMPVGHETAAPFSLIVMAFIGMEKHLTRDSMDWLFTHPQPKIVSALSTVGRLTNDIAYHKSEYRKSGRIVASAVECHMKQYGTTQEEAMNELTDRVVSAWKDVNEECLNPHVPMPLALRILDVVRSNDEMYRDGDGFTQHVLLKDMIESLIINPVKI